jgi:hypothetical protein
MLCPREALMNVDAFHDWSPGSRVVRNYRRHERQSPARPNPFYVTAGRRGRCLEQSLS